MMHLKGYFSSRRRAAFSPQYNNNNGGGGLQGYWLLSHCASPKISIPSCAKKTLLLMQPALIFPMVLIMGAMVLLWWTETKKKLFVDELQEWWQLLSSHWWRSLVIPPNFWCWSPDATWYGCGWASAWWRWCIYGQKWVDGWLNLAALLPLMMMMIMPVSNVLHWRRRKIKVMVHCWCPKF